jgi:hypothetical protein
LQSSEATQTPRSSSMIPRARASTTPLACLSIAATRSFGTGFSAADTAVGTSYKRRLGHGTGDT